MRWDPDARGRLERAAFELFTAQGFAATTVPQITARAGLTTRTFFRHFSDKREVIFADDEIPDLARDYLAHAPLDVDPVTVMMRGLRHAARLRFDGRHERVSAWRAMIAQDESLRERDARKRVDLVRVIGEGFRARGSSAGEAAVLAETSVLLLHLALDAWLAGPPTTSMADVLDEQLGVLRAVLAPSP